MKAAIPLKWKNENTVLHGVETHKTIIWKTPAVKAWQITLVVTHTVSATLVFQQETWNFHISWNTELKKTENIHYTKKLMQAGLVLFDFFLCHFTLIRLKNLYHFLNISDNFQFHVILLRWYVIFFSLTRFGIDDQWLRLSCTGD
jgi:hypothetical protein